MIPRRQRKPSGKWSLPNAALKRFKTCRLRKQSRGWHFRLAKHGSYDDEPSPTQLAKLIVDAAGGAGAKPNLKKPKRGSYVPRFGCDKISSIGQGESCRSERMAVYYSPGGIPGEDERGCPDEPQFMVILE
jgi:hypothetical protein